MMAAMVVVAGIVLALLFVACESSPSGSGDAEELAEMETVERGIEVTSSEFDEGEAIPEWFSCDGEDVSPPLAWVGIPEESAEVAVVVDDPDAPGGTFLHWVLFGLDPATTALAEGAVPDGARQAKNSGGDRSYKGPCPPARDEAHRYRFTVYALSDAIDARDGAGSGEVLDAIRTDAIARGTLTGTFDR